MIIDELVALLGYKVEGEAKAKQFYASLDRIALGATKMAKAVAAAGAVVVGAFGAMGAGMLSLAKSAAAELDPLVKFSDRVNVNIEAVQAWQFAAEQSGASAGEFRTSLETLSKSLGEVARGTGRAKLAFEDYGLSAKDTNGNIKTADVMLLELTDKFQTLSNQQQIDLGQKLGMTPGMITMLRSGRQAIEAYQKQARDGGLIFTEKEARNAERFNDAMSLFEKSIKAIKYRIGVEFLPVLADALDGMQAWIAANQEIIRTNIKQWTGNAIAAMRNFLSVVDSLGTGLDQMGGYLADFLRSISGGKIDLSNLQALGSGLAALLAILKPAWAFAFLLGIAIEDLLTYMRGGDSVTGDLITALADFMGVEPDKVAEVLGDLAKNALKLGGAAAGIGAVAIAFRKLAGAFRLMAGATVAEGIAAAGKVGGKAAKIPKGAMIPKAGLLASIPWAIAGEYIYGDIKDMVNDTKAQFRSDDEKNASRASIDKTSEKIDEIRAREGKDPRGDVWKNIQAEGFWNWIDRKINGIDKSGRPERFDAGRFANDPVAGNDNLAQQMQNYMAHMSKINGPNAAASISNTVNDNRVTNQTFNSTVNQTVTQATQAPEAAARATSAAVESKLAPARITGGGF